PGPEARRTSARRSAPYACRWACNSRALASSPAPSSSTRAASTPSALEPDASPITHRATMPRPPPPADVPPRPRRGGSGGRRQRRGLAGAGLEEALEQLHAQGGGGLGLGVPLHADAEPVRVGRLDRLDHAVGGAGGHAQPVTDLADGLVVGAVDAQL